MSLRALLAAALIGAPAAGTAQHVPGQRPTYSSAEPGSPPNVAAIERRFWAPGLDEGYVPQGMAFAEGRVLMSAYRSSETGPGSGPTRVYAIHPDSGAVLGSFDLPADFGHAGGLAWDSAGKKLYVADTRVLGRFDLERALEHGGDGALEGRWRLGGTLRGSFAAFHEGAVWVGAWNPDANGRLFAIPVAALAPGAELTELDARSSIEIVRRAQGAAFDPGGALWLSASSAAFGALLKLDPGNGRVLARFEAPIGIEDLAFDARGHLWSVSEAGSRRWLNWSLFFPLVFRMDPAKLR